MHPLDSATLWIANSSAHLAVCVAERLRGLDVEVKLWGAQAGEPSVATLSTLGLTATWRGGLAPGALRRVSEHIEASLSTRVDVSDLAAIAGLSDCHFARAFRQSIGVPPHRYLLSRRVEVASDLIQHTDRSLTDIALAVGFSDHSHFTRTFSRIKGETPQAYRRRHR